MRGVQDTTNHPGAAGPATHVAAGPARSVVGHNRTECRINGGLLSAMRGGSSNTEFCANSGTSLHAQFNAEGMAASGLLYASSGRAVEKSVQEFFPSIFHHPDYDVEGMAHGNGTFGGDASVPHPSTGGLSSARRGCMTGKGGLRSVGVGLETSSKGGTGLHHAPHQGLDALASAAMSIHDIHKEHWAQIINSPSGIQTVNENVPLPSPALHAEFVPDEIFPLPDPSTSQRRIVEDMLRVVWNINNPHEYQVRCIIHLCFGDNRDVPRIGLIRKTGDGKSLCFLASAAMRRGVAWSVIPIQALGADQTSSVAKMSNPDAKVYAFHLDSLDEALTIKLAKILLHTKKMEFHTIILFTSAAMLCPDTVWSHCLNVTIANGTTRLAMIDEAHYIWYGARKFRPIFKGLKDWLVGKIWKKVPLLVASATMNEECLDMVCKTLVPDDKDEPFLTEVFHGNMRRRGITIKVTFAYTFKEKLRTSLLPYLKSEDKFIIYTNSATKAIESYAPAIDEFLSDLELSGDVLPLTGQDGIKKKTYVVDLLAGKKKSMICDLKGVACTDTGDMGINAPDSRYLGRIDMPSNIAKYEQEMGRIDRGYRDGTGNQDVYEIFLNLGSYFSLLARTMKEQDLVERGYLLSEHKRVLCHLVLPSECYHINKEREFEPPTWKTLPRRGCGNKCPYCLGDHLNFVRTVKKQNLIDFLTTTVFRDGEKSPFHIAKSIKDNKGKIWEKSSNVLAAHAHALVLQLIASGLFTVSLRKGFDTAKMSPSPSDFRLGWAASPETATEPSRPLHSNPSSWLYINHS